MALKGFYQDLISATHNSTHKIETYPSQKWRLLYSRQYRDHSPMVLKHSFLRNQKKTATITLLWIQWTNSIWIQTICMFPAVEWIFRTFKTDSKSIAKLKKANFHKITLNYQVTIKKQKKLRIMSKNHWSLQF